MALLFVLPRSARPRQNLTFSTASRLVQITLVATGPHGPIPSLSKNDFVVTDDGKPRTIGVFEFNGSDHGHPPAIAPLPRDQFSNSSSGARPGDSVAIILLDCLNATTRMVSGGFRPAFDVGRSCSTAKRGIAAYLTQLDPHASIALWALDARRLVALSDFTGSSEQLQAALRAFHPDEDLQALAPFGDDSLATEGGAEIAAAQKAFDREISRMQHLDRSSFTKVALRAMASHLAQVPGRISLIWVTGGGDEFFANPGMTGAEVVAALGNQRIAVYPVDARELATSGQLGRAGQIAMMNGLEPKGQDELRDIAAQTGGIAFLNRNDLALSIRQAVADSADSYTIGFYIGDRDLDNKFHHLRVSVKARGVRVRYPQGYWALKNAAARDDVSPTALAIASPADAEGIPLAVRIRPTGNHLTIDGTIGIANLAFTRNGALRQDALRIGVVGQTAAGAIAQYAFDVLKLRINDQQYAGALRSGVVLHRNFTPAPGVVTVRIIAEDLASGTVGSVIVPLNLKH